MAIEYNFSKKPANEEVQVSYDPSVIDLESVLSPEEAEQRAKEYRKEKKDLIGSNTQSKLGLESSLGKDERLFQLRSGVESGKYVTVASASKDLKVARSTIITYAKEINVSLFDEEKKVWIGTE